MARALGTGGAAWAGGGNAATHIIAPNDCQALSVGCTGDANYH